MSDFASFENEKRMRPPVFWIFALAIAFYIVYYEASFTCEFPGTVAIMFTNAVVMALIWMKAISVEDFASSFVSVYKDKQFYRVLTAAFTQVTPVHILMNLYSLYNVGSILEPYLNSRRFLWFYFLIVVIGGLLGAAVHKAYLPATPCIGASGAICGMVGVYIAIVIMIYGEEHISSVIPTLAILCLQVFWKKIDSIGHFSGLLTGVVLGVIYLKLLGY